MPSRTTPRAPAWTQLRLDGLCAAARWVRARVEREVELHHLLGVCRAFGVVPVGQLWVYTGAHGQRGVASLGEEVTLVCEDRDGAALFADDLWRQRVAWKWLRASRNAAQGFVARWRASRATRPPIAHEDVRCYGLSVLTADPSPTSSGRLRLASASDLPALHAIEHAALLEEGGPAAVSGDPSPWTMRMRERVARSFTYVIEVDGKLLFRARISAPTAATVMVEDVYTVPSARRRGLATRGVRQLCRRLLGHHRHITLRVRPDNVPAVRLYQELGFVHLGDDWLIRRDDASSSGS